jgi:[acyl-carrier-protein] S-malonyltransferase
MAAILGLDIPTLDRICAEASTADEHVQVANDNCPGQVVISGAKAAVERAIANAKTAGAKRALPLAVSIAAHSPLMASIQGDWNATVEAVKFDELKIPVVGNVHAAMFSDNATARTDIMEQMQSRVRWTESVQTMLGQGIRTFVEVGSGSVLIGLLKRITTEAGVRGLALGTYEDFTALAGG